MTEISTLEKRHHSGSGWLYTIAFLSGLNLILQMAKSNFNFPVGLGIASLGGALFIADGNDLIQIVGVILVFFAFVFAGLIGLFGMHAREKKIWAYIAAMSLYGVDSLVVLGLRDWISAGFHVWGLWSVFNGYKACRELNALPKQEPNQETTSDSATADALPTSNSIEPTTQEP